MRYILKKILRLNALVTSLALIVYICSVFLYKSQIIDILISFIYLFIVVFQHTSINLLNRLNMFMEMLKGSGVSYTISKYTKDEGNLKYVFDIGDSISCFKGCSSDADSILQGAEGIWGEKEYFYTKCNSLARVKKLYYNEDKYLIEVLVNAKNIHRTLSELKDTVENTGLGVVTLDKYKNITSINTTAKQFLNIGPEESYIGLNYQNLVDQAENLGDELKIREVSGFGDTDCSTTYKKSAAGYADMYFTMKLVKNTKDFSKNTSYFIFLTDTTLVQNYIRELNLQKETILEFNKVVTHDIQSPINSIGKHIGLLKRIIPESNKLPQTSVDFIHSNINKIKAIIGNVVKSDSIIDHKDKSRVNFKDILSSVSKSIKDKYSNVIITSNITVDEIFCVKVSLERAVFNIIDNGCKHNSKLLKRIDVKYDGNCITITDNGDGIDSKDIKGIFKTFKRLNTDVAGMGLGLKIIKFISDFHGWSLNVKSTLGKGSEFTITL